MPLKMTLEFVKKISTLFGYTQIPRNTTGFWNGYHPQITPLNNPTSLNADRKEHADGF
jgi:hypothetical protein